MQEVSVQNSRTRKINIEIINALLQRSIVMVEFFEPK